VQLSLAIYRDFIVKTANSLETELEDDILNPQRFSGEGHKTSATRKNDFSV
jgi:hypothetical protein